MDSSDNKRRDSLNKPHIWAFTTYFAEGFPYSLIRTVSGVFFRDMKVSLEAIGLTSLYGIPWTFKFLWSPYIDRFSTKRKWLLSVEFALCCLFLILPFFILFDTAMSVIGIILFFGAFIAATHDIAIDGYYMEALDKAQQSKLVGYRVMAYRIAMMAGSGVIVAIGAKYNWFLAYLAAGMIFTAFFLYHFIFLPEPQKGHKPKTESASAAHYFAAFASFFSREGIAIILSFIILLRAGEFMIGTMLSPFFVDIGLKVHYSWISSLVGLPASIIGAMIGGWAISKLTLEKVIWPFILAQNLTIIIYMILAVYLSDWSLIPAQIGKAESVFSIAVVAGVHFFEQFGGGLGNAVLMIYLMRLCKTEFKAAHYAIGSGLMSLSGIFAGSVSGLVAGQFGYAILFGLSFIISVPGMALIPFLPKQDKI